MSVIAKIMVLTIEIA